MWWVNYYEKTEKIWEASDEAKQERERMVVLKQMCGNGFLASIIAGFLLLVNHWFHQASLWLFFIVALLLLASLFWGHRVHVLRQYAREKVIISSLKK